ncbi:MAG: glycosyltransferase [Bacteroidota bacterium]
MEKPGLLFLTSRFPYPLEKGDKLRAYHLIKALSQDFSVHLFSLSEFAPTQGSISEVEPYCKSIRTVVIPRWKCGYNMLRQPALPFQVAFFTDSAAKRELLDYTKTCKPQYVLCHLIRMAEYAKELTGPKAIDYMDAFSTGMHRYAERCSPVIRPFAKIEAGRLDEYEAKVFNWFNAHFIISEQDRNLIPHADRNQIDIVRNGVDIRFFHPAETEKEFDLLFNGHMAYPPNIASAEYAAREILPLLRKKRPEASLLIAGAEPGKRIMGLSGNGVTVRGWMDDVREAFSSSRILLAPMLISIGLQNKILQAMAMRIPCVVSPMANNALGAKPDEEVLVAESPEEYAQKIEALLENAELYKRISEAGYQYVRKHFSWEEEAKKIKNRLLNFS